LGSNPGLQLLVILMSVISGAIFFFFMAAALIPLFFPYSYSDVPDLLVNTMSPEGIEVLKFLQGFSTFGTFLAPALFCAYLFSTRPASFMGTDNFPRKAAITVFLLLVLTVSGTVISDGLYRLSKAIPLPESLDFVKQFMENLEATYQEQIKLFLQMNSFADFAEIFVVIAVLPAVCEETLFRGVIQPVMSRALKSSHLGIIITAFFFSLLHQQFYSFLSIMVLGVVLGYLRYWSGSLWVSIIMHLINNGMLVIAIYFFDLPVEEANEIGLEETYYFWPGLLIFILSLFGLYRVIKK